MRYDVEAGCRHYCGSLNRLMSMKNEFDLYAIPTRRRIYRADHVQRRKEMTSLQGCWLLQFSRTAQEIVMLRLRAGL